MSFLSEYPQNLGIYQGTTEGKVIQQGLGNRFYIREKLE